MNFLEPPSNSLAQNRSPSQTNFIIEEDSRSDISDFPCNGNDHDGNDSARDWILSCCSSLICLRLTLGGMCFLLISLALTASAFIFLYLKAVPPFETCKTKQCTRTATLLVKTIDETVDPCENFHKFACGNWISDTAAVVSVAVYDHTTIMRDRIVGRLRSTVENITNEDIDALQQVRILYNTCVDLAGIEEAGLKPLIDLIKQLFGTPDEKLGRILGRIHRETNQDYLFDLSISPNFLNTTFYQFNIDQPELPVVKANFLYSPSIITAYETLIEKVFTRISREPGFPISIPDPKKAAKRVSALERILALYMSDEEDRGKAATANLISTKQLNYVFSVNLNLTTEIGRHQFLNWTEYVETLFEGISDVEVSDDFYLNVNDIPYIRNLAGLLQKTDPNHIKLYVMWELLYTFGKDVNKEVRDLFNVFTTVSEGTESTPNRHTECVLLLDQAIPFALTHKYVLNYVKSSTISEVKEMFRNVLHAFKSLIKTGDWMDGETKFRALEKANRVEAYIGFPAWLKNASAVNAYYKGLKFSNNSFFRNILAMMKWITEKHLKGYDTPVDRTWTSDSPAEADAYYDDELNSITFPAGFLQEPFIGMGLKAIDYGALGSVLGHELTHGFDTMGRYSDAYGRLNSWWTLETLQHFVAKAQCFDDQYSTFWLPELAPVPGPNNTVNGKRTLAENIADNGGIREAFQAYRYYVEKRGPEPRLPGLEKYSPEQLFFLSFAQSWCSYLSPAALTDMVETNVHAPPQFRIIGPLLNFPEFAKVWKCHPHSRMNPDNSQRCVLWG